jgi:hypothetical protein
MLITR